MLYLVKLDNAYKIGYSANVEERIKQLSSTHVEIELLSIKAGNKQDEKELHKLCKEYFIKNELFMPTKEVVKIFNTYICEHLIEDIKNFNQRYKELSKQFDDLAEQFDNLTEITKALIKTSNGDRIL